MKRRAFTLPELLVVIGIIVVLISMLLPALSRARAQALLLQCESNLRQFAMADQMYVNDNKQTLAFANWNFDPSPQSFPNAPTGWLYTCPLVVSQDSVQLGSYWKYLKSAGVYHCPSHVLDNWIDPATMHSAVLSSYVMNGAVSAYGANQNGTQAAVASYYRSHKFKSDDVLMWEGSERNKYSWNDGSSRPDESYDPSGPMGKRTRHGFYIATLSMDGHVEAMRGIDFWNLASQPYRNRLWCNPNTVSGHIKDPFP